MLTNNLSYTPHQTPSKTKKEIQSTWGLRVAIILPIHFRPCQCVMVCVLIIVYCAKLGIDLGVFTLDLLSVIRRVWDNVNICLK